MPTTSRRDPSIIIIAIAAAAALLYWAHEVVVPVVLAIALAMLLRPVVRWLEDRGIAPAITSATIVIVILGTIWTAGLVLTPTVRRFVARAPQIAAAARVRMQRWPAPANRLATFLPEQSTISSTGSTAMRNDSTRADSVRSDSTSVPARADSAGGRRIPSTSPARESGSSGMPGGSVLTHVFGTARSVTATFLEMLLLLAFFLGGGSKWDERLRESGPHGRAMAEVGTTMQGLVARYLGMTALINVVQGAVVGVALLLLGLPGAAVWGVLTFALEFLPYFGAAVMVVLLTATALAAGDGGQRLLFAPLIYLAITNTQNNLVSPIAYGRSLALNPAAILVSVMVWYFIWGVPGAFLAVPLLALLRVVSERSPRMAAVRALIGEA